MLSTTSRFRHVAKRAVQGAAATGGAVGLGLTIYANTQSGLGFRREVQFWTVVSPVVIDYWWNSSRTSPYVKLQKLLNKQSTEESDDKKAKEALLKQLNERNAPKIFNVMLQLGGLYIKLGQVLSVTALPIPDEYRTLFRTLQSSVPGHEEFETVVRPTLERELQRPLDDIFESIDEIPSGAASIGQAHKAVLRETGEAVIIKVQYPNAKWQVPADIHCVGDFLKLCTYFGLVDEQAAKLSYDEFARQFLSELDYERERDNLQQVFNSTRNPDAPYKRRGVVIPKVYPNLCTNQIITMEFLPGPKFEEEAKQQLAMLGINTDKSNIRDIVKDAAEDRAVVESEIETTAVSKSAIMTDRQQSWKFRVSKLIGNLVGVDSIFSVIRLGRRLLLWSQAAAAAGIRSIHTLAAPVIPAGWEEWAREHEHAALQAARMNWTKEAVDALLDVHGYQIFNQGLFNADPHPGNILIIQDADATTRSQSSHKPKIGLIDYGQAKRLTPLERVKVARLLLSVADNASDEAIASNFRAMGIQTKNNSTVFLAEFARLMFGSFQPKHLDHSFHHKLHQEDRVIYFPNELSMVYRTSLLLRGLAMSLQFNVSVGEQWREHAQKAIDAYHSELDVNEQTPVFLRVPLQPHQAQSMSSL